MKFQTWEENQTKQTTKTTRTNSETLSVPSMSVLPPGVRMWDSGRLCWNTASHHLSLHPKDIESKHWVCSLSDKQDRIQTQMFHNIATTETSLLSVCSKSPEQLSDIPGMWHLVYDTENEKTYLLFFFLKKRRQYYFIISNRKQIWNLSYPDEYLSPRSRRRGRKAPCQRGSITVAVSQRAHSASISSCIYFKAFAVTSFRLTFSRG